MTMSAVRLGHLDSLKLFLTVLVIAHHAAITYGAGGSWFYVEPSSSEAFRAIGTLFTATNQFFFMGLLGIPLVVFSLVAAPYVVGPWLKFVVTVLGATTCFAASHFVLRRSEVVRRVL